MSVTSRNPLRMAGASLHSGNINTGELATIRGGGQAASIYSGAVAPGLTAAYGSVNTGSDVLLFSGAGRLNSFQYHTYAMVSGLSVKFYDAGAVSSGGPFYSSGHKILFTSPPTWGAYSGSPLTAPAGPINIDMPFQSGLCFNSASGQPGFTVSWTPEVNPGNPNN